MTKYRVTRMPDQQFALTGCVMVSRDEFGESKRHFRLTNTSTNKSIVYTGIGQTKIDPKQIGLSGVQREHLRLAEGEDVEVVPFTPDRTSTLTMVKIEIDFYQKTNIKKQFDADAMVKDIQQMFSGTIFAVGHQLPYKFEQSPFFRIHVKGQLHLSFELDRINY